MFIVKGSTRIVRCCPSLGIVIKTPRDCLGDFGIKANGAEVSVWGKTHNPLLAPVLSTSLGKVVMSYYPRAVNDKITHFPGFRTEEMRKQQREEFQRTFLAIAGKILGKRLFEFFSCTHDAQAENFRFTKEGKLVMVDYGISNPDHQERFLQFLDKYGQKLVEEYVEPPL